MGRSPELFALGCALAYTASNLLLRGAAVGVDRFVAGALLGTPVWVAAVVVTMAGERRQAFLPRSPSFGGWPVLLRVAGAGLAMYAVGNPAFVLAIQLGGIAVASPSSQTVVLWSSLLAFFLLAEPVDRRLGVGIAAYLAGAALLAWGQTRGAPLSPHWYLGFPLAMLAGLCWAAGNVTTRYALGRGLDAIALLALAGTTGFTALYGWLLITGGIRTLAGLAPATAGLLLAAGLLNGLAQLSMVLALRRGNVGRVAIVASSSVIIAAVLARVIFGDTLNPLMLVGIMVMVWGIGMTGVAGRRSR